VARIGMRGRTCCHRVGSLKPAFKDSVVKKLACFSRIRLSPVAQWWQIETNLNPPRVSTVVLHRPNPVAREMPVFIGFFARRG
jgi:hypothetical protein